MLNDSPHLSLAGALIRLSRRWVEEQNRTNPRATLHTLSSRATSDGKLFRRLERGGQISTTTFEAVARFLAEPRNWPAAMIPTDAVAVLDCLGQVASVANRVAA